MSSTINDQVMNILDDKNHGYLLPNHIDETGRINNQHLILRFIFQRNFFAPLNEQLEKGITVLDSGCGPGSWTLDMAHEFPNSKFHGIDITDNFRSEGKPNNCEFVLGNISEKIPYPDNYFDYVHQRLLILGLTLDGWNNTLKEIMRVLKPGGYIELVEFDTKELDNIGPFMDRIQDIVRTILITKKMPINIACHLEEVLTRLGFENCVNNPKLINLNHTNKSGELFWENYVQVTKNTQPVLAMFNSEWKDDDTFRKYLEACGEESKQLKTSIKYYSCYAQKPFE